VNSLQTRGARYELAEPLGHGAHGTVYRAVQSPLDREVALKLWDGASLDTPGSFDRWAREVKLLKRLAHPNTVRLFDFGTTDQGVPFIVFELLRGRPLGEEIARGPMPAARVARVAGQVLRALMEAHGLGIVHRDIKPSNLLLVDFAGETDFVKLLDFGVARGVDIGPSRAITQSGQLIGTPRYMAPEQVKEGQLGPATDLYALGLTMAEMLAGAPVFAEVSPLLVYVQQSSPNPVPLCPAVTASPLGDVIRRATAKPMEQRFGSAAEMLAALERALARPSEPARVEPSSSLSMAALAVTPRSSSSMARFSSTLPLPQRPVVRAPAPPLVIAVRPPAAEPKRRPTSRSSSRLRLALVALTAALAALVFLFLGHRALDAPLPSAGAGAPMEWAMAPPPDGKLARVDLAFVTSRFGELGWTVRHVDGETKRLRFATFSKGVDVVSVGVGDFATSQELTGGLQATALVPHAVMHEGLRVVLVACSTHPELAPALLEQLVR
jgi:serine/threonine-protein kinase